jgi:hypothetical protein
MNFVYLCRHGENEELRYSIRSVVKNTENPQIWLVGGKPSWYTGNFVKSDQSKDKYENVVNSLNTIVNCDSIPDDFILMNDDFYIIKPIDKINTYHGGDFKKKVEIFSENAKSSYYTSLLQNTKKQLQDAGIENPLDYAIHVPIELNKQKLSTVIKPKISIRTMYGNLFNIGGTEINDVKFHRQATRRWAKNPSLNSIDFEYLSTNDESFIEVYETILKDMFKEPSQYEG